MTEREEALRFVTSVIERCRRMQPRFAPGTAQHTLLKNRIRAMEIARSLLESGHAEGWPEAELAAAREPIASIIRKCGKARSKYGPGTAQYRRFDRIVRAMELSAALLQGELENRRETV